MQLQALSHGFSRVSHGLFGSDLRFLRISDSHGGPPLSGSHLFPQVKKLSNLTNFKECANYTMQTPSVAGCRDILGAFYDALYDACLVAGERESVLLTYLAAQTRRFTPDVSGFRPVGLTAVGQSSSGKSHAQDLALRAVPADDVVRITGMSDKLLTRKSTADFAGKVVVLGEADAMRNRDVERYFRKLFDDGHLIYEVLVESVDKKTGEMRHAPRRYELGPGAWFSLMTSTTSQLNEENATRQLTVYSDDSDEQTREVLKVSARRVNSAARFDPEPWQEFDRWQSAQDWSAVEIPYLSWLASNVSIFGPSVRRTFMAVSALIAAHALLHRCSREVSGDGRVVATVQDYLAVRSLVEPFLLRDAAEVTPGVRDLVAVVSKLTGPGCKHADDGVTMNHVIPELGGVSRATAYRRRDEAEQAGFIERVPGRYPPRFMAVDGLAVAEDSRFILPVPRSL